MEYDPNRSPAAEQWLKLDEAERIGLVMEYHAQSDTDVPNPVLHATFHTVVENQLAESISEIRSTFDTHLPQDGLDIRTVQELLGHKDVATTMIYADVLNRGERGIRSPADKI